MLRVAENDRWARSQSSRRTVETQTTIRTGLRGLQLGAFKEVVADLNHFEQLGRLAKVAQTIRGTCKRTRLKTRSPT